MLSRTLTFLCDLTGAIADVLVQVRRRRQSREVMAELIAEAREMETMRPMGDGEFGALLELPRGPSINVGGERGRA
jgi:hypothetical protein